MRYERGMGTMLSTFKNRLWILRSRQTASTRFGCLTKNPVSTFGATVAAQGGRSTANMFIFGRRFPIPITRVSQYAQETWVGALQYIQAKKAM